MSRAVRGKRYSAYRSSTTRSPGACWPMTRWTARYRAFSRASRGSLVRVVMTPDSSTTTPPGPASSTPNPVLTRPGSIPMTRSTPPARGNPAALASRRGDGFDDLVGDVVVGGDGLYVVLLLQRLDQPQHRRGVLALDL